MIKHNNNKMICYNLAHVIFNSQYCSDCPSFLNYSHYQIKLIPDDILSKLYLSLMIDIFQTDQHMCAVCSAQATQQNIVHILQLILEQVGVVGLYKCQEEELICLQKQVLLRINIADRTRSI